MDEVILFDKQERAFVTLGIGVLTDCIKCEITEIINDTYDLQLEYPVFGRLAGEIEEERILYAKEQPFRIVKITKELKKYTVYAKHIFFDTSDLILSDVYPTDLTAVEALRWIMNRTDHSHYFIAGGNLINIGSARYVRKSLCDAILYADNAIVKRYGGEILRDGYRVSIMDKLGHDNGYRIEYRKNLTGITFDLDMTNVVTRVLAEGSNEFVLDHYVDSQLINNYYGIRTKKVSFELDANDYGSESEATEALEKMAIEYVNLHDTPEISIKVDFIELSKTEEYKNYQHLETVGIGDDVVCNVPFLGIGIKTRVIKTVYDNIKKRYTKLELGTVSKDIISQIKDMVYEQQKVSQKLANMDTSILNDAKKQASDLINDAMGGYIVKTRTDLLILDTDNINTAKNVWRWNMGGLGYSKNGINGPYETAIVDGHIVADIITAGILHGVIIEGNEIRGGSININNLFTVDSNGHVVAKDIVLADGVDIGNYQETSSYKYIMFGGTTHPSPGSEFVGNAIIYENNTIGVLSKNKAVLWAKQSPYGGGFVGVYSDGKVELSSAPVYPSDIRKKKNICKIDISEIIDGLDLFSFDYKDGAADQVGVIAQKLKDSKYARYIIRKDADGYLAVNYNVLFLAAVQKLQRIEKELKELKGGKW